MSLKDRLSQVMSYFVETPTATAPQAPTVPPILVDPTKVPPTPTEGDQAASDTAPAGGSANGASGSTDSWNSALEAVERARAEAVAKGLSLTPPKTIEQIVRESEGPNLDEIHVNFGEAIPTLPDGTLNFSALYAKAALPDPPFTAEQLLQMLSELPAAMPLEMKRQTVKVTISALGRHIGASPETIVADASRKLAALAAFVDESETRTGEFVAATEAEIAALLNQVEEKRQSVTASTQRLVAVQRSCEREADRLDDILGFFSQEVTTGTSTPAPANPITVLAEDEDDTPPTIPLPNRLPEPVVTDDTNPDASDSTEGNEISLAWERAPSVEVGPPTETPPPLPVSADTKRGRDAK